MKMIIKILIISAISVFTLTTLNSMDYKSADFVGTWHGTISNSENEYKTTLVIYEDGFYIESSGSLMPGIYPDTQTFEFDAETNRLHFKYLQIVYAGRKTYTHIFYELISFENGNLEAHYNFWDDEEPNPDFGVLKLKKEGTLDVAESTNIIDRQLVRVVNSMGIEVSPETKNEFLIFQYDDGSIEKKIIMP